MIAGGAGGDANTGAYTHGGTGGVGVNLVAAVALTNIGSILGGRGGYGFEGGDGGRGLIMAGAATVDNRGYIGGGSGAPGYNPYKYYTNGGHGGIGVDMSGAGTLVNHGTISGGGGGYGYYGYNLGGIGVLVEAGGVVINDRNISGGLHASAGIEFSHGGTLVNYGKIAGGNYYAFDPAGVSFLAGGTVMNAGTIVGGAGLTKLAIPNPGGAGIYFEGAGTVSNSGTIIGGVGGDASYNYRQEGAGTGGTGVQIVSGATLVNGGVILGGQGGPRGEGDVFGSGGIGAALDDGGALINTGSITGGASPNGKHGAYGRAEVKPTNLQHGGIGVGLFQGGTLTNSGTITGGAGSSHGQGAGGNGGAGVYLNGGTLVNAGTIIGGAAGDAKGGAGQAGDAVQFGAAAATLAVDPGAIFIGDVAAQSNDTLVLAGTSSGTLSGLGETITGFISIGEDAGAYWTLAGTASQAATVAIGSGATLILDGNFAAGVTFVSGGGLLDLPALAQFTGQASGFGTGDVIDLANQQAKSLSYSNGTLTLFDAGGSTLGTLHFTGSYQQADFALQADGATGTEITYAGADFGLHITGLLGATAGWTNDAVTHSGLTPPPNEHADPVLQPWQPMHGALAG
jgi:hypothetical protein